MFQDNIDLLSLTTDYNMRQTETQLDLETCYSYFSIKTSRKKFPIKTYNVSRIMLDKKGPIELSKTRFCNQICEE